MSPVNAAERRRARRLWSTGDIQFAPYPQPDIPGLFPDWPFVSIWRRSTAYLVDVLLFALATGFFRTHPAWVHAARIRDLAPDSMPDRLAGAFSVVSLWITITAIYAALGTSPGKALCGLVILTRDETRPGPGAGLLRAVLPCIPVLAVLVGTGVFINWQRGWHKTHDDASFAGLWLVLGAIPVLGLCVVDSVSMVLSDTKQAVHDRLAGTYVICRYVRACGRD